jgi:hypothetical protein
MVESFFKKTITGWNPSITGIISTALHKVGFIWTFIFGSAPFCHFLLRILVKSDNSLQINFEVRFIFNNQNTFFKMYSLNYFLLLYLGWFFDIFVWPYSKSLHLNTLLAQLISNEYTALFQGALNIYCAFITNRTRAFAEDQYQNLIVLFTVASSSKNE